MHFPVSGIDVFPLIPVAVGFGVSFLCSLGGLSGSFLLLPFQMSFLGFTTPAVSPTNHLYNVVSTPGGAWRLIRERRMVWPLTLVVIAGSVPGTLVGSVIRVACLPDPQVFKLFAAMVLLYIGASLFWGLFRVASRKPYGRDGGPAKRHAVKGPSGEDPFTVHVREFSSRRISYAFMGEEYAASSKGVFLLCFLVGIVGGAYGIGGGAIIGPFLVSFFRLPIYTVAATTLAGNFITSLSGLLFFLGLSLAFPGESVAPDWTLGLFFGLGGLLGIYCGSRAQRHVPEVYIKILLSLILAGTAARYLWEALG